MLVRQLSGGGALCVGQASHAWLAGQVARAWAWPLGPLAEPLLLAATAHDVGMAQWDRAPALDPGTGLPIPFQHMPLDAALTNWTQAPHLLETQSVVAALLVSHHGRRLFERRRPDPRIEAYLAGQRALQEDWTARLGLDAADVGTAVDLLRSWDTLSLAAILDWTPYELPPVPDPDGARVSIHRDGERLDPWPFTTDEVVLTCEGRHLDGPSTSPEQLAERLAAATPTTLEISLRRSRPR